MDGLSQVFPTAVVALTCNGASRVSEVGGKGGGDWIGGGRRVSRLSSLDRASAINRLICYRPWTRRVDEFAPPTSQMMLSCCACGATNQPFME